MWDLLIAVHKVCIDGVSTCFVGVLWSWAICFKMSHVCEYLDMSSLLGYGISMCFSFGIYWIVVVGDEDAEVLY